MRKNIRRITSLLLSFMIFLSFMPAAAFAAPDDGSGGGTVRMTAGDIFSGYEGYVSEDPTTAWVDGSGNLNAMKEGETVLKAASGSAEDQLKVIVSRYDDGSDTVGRLKILARYNDDMQFYDGHVYLLFTSYKDGVKVTVDDLYAAYEISDSYYRDIRKDISNGSNHTGKDADKYFTYRDDLDTMVLDRGEIVTIGMYRDFDLTVPQAALGSLRNSSLWGGLRREGKTAAIENLFALVELDKISFEKAYKNCKEIIEDAGLDYRKWTDGVVDGGVCFNRELYNQKLEWDQYENVTYELDITRNQLDALTDALSGNNENFSIMNNSCATVAVGAWNAAVGTRNGKDTAYKLYKNGSGIYSEFDAPKSVRDSIVDRLPGYYLNNSSEVQEPGAGFRDETGWVYVSAPEDLESGDIPSYEKYDLNTYIGKAEGLNLKTEVYTIGDGGEREAVGADASFEEGREIFVKTTAGEGGDLACALSDITMNGSSFMDDEHFDADEQAYVVKMPAKKSSKLRVYYRQTELRAKGSTSVQTEKGGTLRISDYAELSTDSDRMKWEIVTEDGAPANNVVTYADDSHKVLKASAEGSTDVWAYAEGNSQIRLLFHINVYRSRSSMAAVSFDDSGSIRVAVTDENGDPVGDIPCSGYLVPKGTKLKVIPAWTDSKVLASVRAGIKSIGPGETFTADRDVSITYTAREASVTGVPEKISLAKKGDTYQLKAKTRYSGIIAGLLPVYDKSITYISSSPLVSVSDSGLIKVTGDIPENGMAVYVTAYAGSSGDTVCAPCKVVVGKYNGDRIVGTLTIHARTINKGELVAHGAMTFTAKEDVDLSASYYEYYKPNSKHIALLEDYNENPGKYAHDPALYNNNELGISREERESCFDVDSNGAGSEPENISLKKGESMTVSNYSFDDTNLTAMVRALENSEITSSKDTAELIRQIHLYQDGSEEFDPEEAFDGLASTIVQMYRTKKKYGYIPACGHSEGGTCIDRELFNQFRRNDIQTPNNYYTVDITAEEFAAMAGYMADPANNYYSIFSKNCASGARDAWNAALSDRPELRLKANYTNILDDPQSLYFELGLLRGKKISGGKGGTDFYPRAILFEDKSAKPEPAPSPAPAPATEPIDKGLGMDISKLGKMTLRWGRVSGASGYDIYVRTNDKKNIYTKKTATVLSGKTTKKSLSRLYGKRISRKTTYRFVVKAYKRKGLKKVYIATSKVYVRKGTK